MGTEARMVFIIMIVSFASHFHRSHLVTENQSLADSHRLAAFVPGARRYLVLAFHFHVGRPLYLWE
jgi:hypothetical protein